ncbi:protein of unknown function [Bartonella clarridgeiae 73]|uniref:Uncharacterized protein n=1 Tax=Bartonella clarridgeiae (strain CCUG 45776 / CIP 104772 / 73) TaxID=696125 RepID=E6YJA2_BARC7|nr:protein of unknown function [Bartonella clarridgeiae 73]
MLSSSRGISIQRLLKLYGWSVPYMAPNVSIAIMLIKIRYQFGLRNFAELSILGFFLVCILHLFVTDLHSALIIRFFASIAAAPMTLFSISLYDRGFCSGKEIYYWSQFKLYECGFSCSFIPFDFTKSPRERRIF